MLDNVVTGKIGIADFDPCKGYPFVEFVYGNRNDLTMELLVKLIVAEQMFFNFFREGERMICCVSDGEIVVEKREEDGVEHTYVERHGNFMLKLIGIEDDSLDTWRETFAELGAWTLVVDTAPVIWLWVVGRGFEVMTFRVNVEGKPVGLSLPREFKNGTDDTEETEDTGS